MKKYEYQHVSTNEYLDYAEKANALLSDISCFLNIGTNEITYHNVIYFFQSQFNIHFSFFEADPAEVFAFGEKWSPTTGGISRIKHKDLIPEADFHFLPIDIVDRISGITIPSGNRTLIMINQDRVLQRIIFTILHELCHFYFHIRDKDKKRAFVSLTNDHIEGQYSEDLVPFETEANIIGSILFCPGARLEHMLFKKYTFKDMCRTIGMSEPAMHNRLLNYIEHVLKIPYRLALNYVWKFRSDNYKIRHILRYKAQQQIDWRLANKEAETLTKIQSAYVDKLKSNIFWGGVVEELSYSDTPISNFENDDLPNI